jgi:hypothetical protein
MITGETSEFLPEAPTLLFDEWFLAALPWAALLEMHSFQWTYFHKRALLYPQRCSQGRSTANATPRLEVAVLCRAAK